MKYLKIEQGKGYFQKVPDKWVELDQIGKEDLLSLMDKVILDEFEMDEFNTDLLDNKAHQIIYKHLFQKFNELLLDKSRFRDESVQIYRDALEKYKE